MITVAPEAFVCGDWQVASYRDRAAFPEDGSQDFVASRKLADPPILDLFGSHELYFRLDGTRPSFHLLRL
jgi:hypothetical protein